MGTRSLICVWYKGRFMVAQYCQWDGYLEGQGAIILEFLLVPGNIERLKKGLSRITPVDDATVEEMVSKHSYLTLENNKKVCECGAAVGLGEPQNCLPSTLHRNTGAKILDIVAAARIDDYIPIHLQVAIAVERIYDYCYCVDLDAEVFEVFRSSTDIPTITTDEKIKQTGKNRFAEVCKTAEVPRHMTKSVPKFLKSWPLAELPKDLDDMLNQVAADNIGKSKYEDGDHENPEDSDDSEDGSAKSEAKGDDAKGSVIDDNQKGGGTEDDDQKTRDNDKPVDEGDDKESQGDNFELVADVDKKAVVADDDKKTIDDEAQEPEDDRKAVALDEEDHLYHERKTFKDAKEKAEYEERIESIANDLLIEAAQESIRRERERAAMQQVKTKTAGD